MAKKLKIVKGEYPRPCDVGVDDVPAPLESIVMKGLSRDPAERYASIERFVEDIAAHLQRRPVGARAGAWRFTRQRAPFHLQVAAIGIAAQLAATFDQRRVE